jgi:hypothetical protein
MEGTLMMIKTFRGLLADGGQERISLSSIKGKVGYRIIKFELFPNRPGGTSHVESIMQIFKSEQITVPTANSIVDFSDGSLLAAAYLTDDVNNASGPLLISMFEKEIFNQDVYITHTDEAGSAKANYYLEVEQMTLASDEATVATLKDIKLNA